MYFAWSITKKTKWRKTLKTKWRLEVCKQVHAKKHSYGVLYQSMPSCISRKCLLDGQTLANTDDRGGPAKAKMSRWLWGNCEGTFPCFFGRQNTRCPFRERMNGLISKYLEEYKKAFPAKRRQRQTGNLKPLTALCRWP